jgi:DNA-binding NtrC family response regulator
VKPWDRHELLVTLERELGAINRKVSALRSAHDFFWGESEAMRALQVQLKKLAHSPLTPVLLEGETGVGKEMVAQQLHELTQSNGAFAAINCASVPASLMESELFGHERGAFTGAHARRRGVVELANKGTLFLDEIGEMDVALQPKLLRFLQDHRYRRVGGELELTSTCRIIAATNRDLGQLQADGRFRPDLFYRLAVVRVTIPSLTNRLMDLLPLATFLVQSLSATMGKSPKPFAASATEAMLAHAWPGNIRELKNRIERALVLGESEAITAKDLDLKPTPMNTESWGDPRERQKILEALQAENWNIAATCRTLGVARHWLRYRMKRHQLIKKE